MLLVLAEVYGIPIGSSGILVVGKGAMRHFVVALSQEVCSVHGQSTPPLKKTHPAGHSTQSYASQAMERGCPNHCMAKVFRGDRHMRRKSAPSVKYILCKVHSGG